MANKIEHLEVIADHIERNIGGFSNVATLTHCMTRVRLVLKIAVNSIWTRYVT
ncbi:PTS transporter subunit EIIB [Plesiomonas shigelloides subsp. oncorhynchi]|nr:PTS transporter subunit EIIB [Plesiomonas shigelloides]